MNGPPSLADILASPSVFPQGYQMAQDAVRLIHLSPAMLEEVSFLDDRVLNRRPPARLVGFDTLAAAADVAGIDGRCGFIFHLGHVGSTLVSRLLGAHPTVLAVREPGALRTLAELAVEAGSAECLLSAEALEHRLSVLLRLWSRTFRPDQLSIIKATSLCSQVAGDLLAAPGRPRALALVSPPDIHLPVMLSGADARGDVRSYAANRIRRLHQRLGGPQWRLADMSIGELVAMAWASEMCALVEAAGQAQSRWRWLDFDVFLAEPQAGLSQAFAHFERPVSEAEIAAILAGPLMSRYSKGAAAFDASTRADKIAAARTTHAVEIARGRLWLDRAAEAHAEIAQAIDCVQMAPAA